MLVTIFLTILILIGVVLLVKRLINKKSNPTEDDLNRIALKKLDSSYGLNNHNPETCEWIDKLLIDGIKSGIESYDDAKQYDSIVVFNNETTYAFWNANKYYGWLSKGSFNYFDENSNEDIFIEYDKEQPSPDVMLRFKILIDKFIDGGRLSKDMISPNAKITRIKREENV